MSDQNIREIHLGGKQLVFLFMASVVVAVAVFLLGISVGRGVRDLGAEPAATTDVAVAPEPPTEMPPPTTTTPADLSYHNQLQGQAAPAAEPTKPVEPPPPASEPAQEPARSSSAGAGDRSGGAAAEQKPAEKAAEKPAATPRGPAGGWYVQANAFRSRENADKEAANLKAKNYGAVSVSSNPPGSLFRVRVGPFSDRSEAERVAERLRREEGRKPSIQP
jgi:cell division septation protein DedD